MVVYLRYSMFCFRFDQSKKMDLSSLPKIKKITRSALEKDKDHLGRSTKAIFSNCSLSMLDCRNIYKNNTVLFLGDNFIRTVYRDLCQQLKYGRLLDFTEVNRQNGLYKPLDGYERILFYNK